ncbi:MAG: O-antigen ligase family protein [Acidobacteriota bacterium]
MSSLQAQTIPAAGKKSAVARREKPSFWLWVPFIWLFFDSTRELSTWMAWDRMKATNSDLGGSPVDRLLMITLMLLGFWVLGRRWNQTKRILLNNKWILVLFAYMALSVIWSNYPGMTVRRCIRSMGNLEMVLVVLTERNPLEAIRSLLRRLFLLILPLSLYTIRWMRNIGVAYDWSGVYEEWIGLSTDKNSLGQVCLCGGLFLFWEILHEWPNRRKTKKLFRRVMVEGFVLLVTLYLLHGSKNVHSSSSIVGFLICSMVLVSLQLIRKKAQRAKRMILVAAVSAIVLTPIVYMVFDALDTTPVKLVLQATGRDMTLTDRTLIWEDVLNNAAKQPIFGVGMGAYWVGPIGYGRYPMPNWSAKTPQWRPEEGHNGYIDIYAELGLVGEAIMICMLVTAFAGALDHLETDFQYGSLRLILLLSIVINNFTETSYLKGTHFMWFLLLMAAINMPAAVKRKARAKVSPWAAVDSTEAVSEAPISSPNGFYRSLCCHSVEAFGRLRLRFSVPGLQRT